MADTPATPDPTPVTPVTPDEGEIVTSPSGAHTNELVTVPGGVPDLDKDVYEAAAIASLGGECLRIRMALQTYHPPSRGYQSWKGVVFGMAFATPEDAIAFRGDLEAFVRGWFETVGGR